MLRAAGDGIYIYRLIHDASSPSLPQVAADKSLRSEITDLALVFRAKARLFLLFVLPLTIRTLLGWLAERPSMLVRCEDRYHFFTFW